MAKIVIEDPKALGKKLKFSIEDLFEVLGESLKSAASLNPLSWLEGLGILVGKLGKVKRVDSLEGKTYLWIYRSLASSLIGVIRDSPLLEGLKINGEWYDEHRSRFEEMFQGLTLEVDRQFLREPVQYGFLKKYFDDFQAWSMAVLNLNDKRSNQLRSAYHKRFREELWIKVAEGECKEIIAHIRHGLSDEALKAEVRYNYREWLHSLYLRDVMLEEGMRLADVYIEPDFYVHADCLPEGDKRKKNLMTMEGGGTRRTCHCLTRSSTNPVG